MRITKLAGEERHKTSLAKATLVLSTKIFSMGYVSINEILMSNMTFYVGTFTDKNRDRFDQEMKEGKKFGRCTI